MAPGAFSRDELERAATWCGRRYRDLLAHLAGRGLERPWSSRPRTTPCCCAPFSCASAGSAAAASRCELRHVAIDEVQDFSPLEVRVLHRLSRRAAQHDARRRHAAARPARRRLLVVERLLPPSRSRRNRGRDAARRLPFDPRDRRSSRRPSSATCARTTRRRSPRAVARRWSSSASPTTARRSPSSPAR